PDTPGAQEAPRTRVITFLDNTLRSRRYLVCPFRWGGARSRRPDVPIEPREPMNTMFAQTPAPASSSIIRLRDVGKHIETRAGRINLLNHLNLEVRQGEFLSIMGPSGAWKSTLLNILGLFDGDFTGEYELLGHAVQKTRPKERRDLSRRY